MNVKVISAKNDALFESKIQNFVHNKKVIDIKLSECPKNWTALILY